MKVKLTAPEGYKYKDKMTDKTYSVLIIESKDKKRFELVADNRDKIITED